MPALFYAPSRDIIEEDDLNNTIKVYSGPIHKSMAEATLEEKDEEEFLDKEEITRSR
jgi:hypothetical protein